LEYKETISKLNTQLEEYEAKKAARLKIEAEAEVLRQK